jgi:hypothetical protein
MNLLLADLQYWLRLQQAWCDLRNCQEAGWRYTLERRRWWPRILRIPPSPCPPPSPDHPVELHTMCHRGDWPLVLWMVKSLHDVTPDRWPVVVHVQGFLPPSAIAHLRHHLPGARIILREEADPAVTAELIRLSLPRCLHWRHELGIMHKLFDVHLLASSPVIAFADADVLFFRRPTELLEAATPALAHQYFQGDIADCYTLSPAEARTQLGIDLAPALNTGITLRPRAALDLRQIESLLASPAVARRSGHLEQTLHALAASVSGLARRWSPDYVIDMRSTRDPASMVCRHYAGPSKRFINNEGLRWLWHHAFQA